MLPPDIVRLSLPSPFAIGDVNAYLLRGDPLTLVDPGPRTRKTRAALEQGLHDHGIRVRDIELVVLTHQHHDHVGLAGEVRERSGSRVAAIEPLQRFLADFDAAMDVDDAYAGAIMVRHGVEPDVADSLQDMSVAFRRFAASVEVDTALGDGDRVRFGARDFVVHARPGHSPTDTVFHGEGDGLLIGGDHLLEHVSSNPIAHAPIGITDPAVVACSADRPRPLQTYLNSMSATQAMDVELVLPGHGVPFTGHAELVIRRQGMHARRSRKILDEVDGLPTAADIAAILWRRAPVTQTFLALSETLAHLDLLVDEGLVEEVVDGDVVRWRRTGREQAA